MKVKDEFVGVIEGLAVRPVLKPLDDAVKRLVLKELYLWFLGAYASLLGSFLILRLRG
ncbi:MAG: hypothetical protein F7C35_03675 [Desulfurococcales archaeon]|nr:hypothetical protein [Desulfurococcales archaeon]